MEHTNALANETSPYLLQHAHNPVDWHPWGEEALDKAKREDKPIFLSIGYSACHWCHVMERESFENAEIAALLNEHFVSIKVDREERPDLDDIYMSATVAQTGSGGWPMSCFLTPELQPFYCGTYYPPQDAFGRPGFGTLLNRIIDVWRNRRDEINQAAEAVAEYVEAQMSGHTQQGEVTPTLLNRAAERLQQNFDAQFGGWGGAPKFPSSGSIMVLMRNYRRTQNPTDVEMAERTLERMAYGGMYDQLGGGFHRYSVDAEWLVPHFEKMLYDNGQLVQAYLEAWQLTEKPLYRRIAAETLDYVLRDMRSPQGGFYSSEDADSEGEEGKFYIWTADELEAALGKEDAAIFNAYYNVRPEGNFSSHESYHAGKNILHVARTPEAVAQELGLTPQELHERLAPMRKKLLEVRRQRVRPGLDDKILSSWNGLMISAMAQGSRILGGREYRDAAVAAGEFIVNEMIRDSLLLRTHRAGESRLPGYLDDYAFIANAFVDLYEATFDVRWLREADQLTDAMLDQFWDARNGGFFFTSAQHKNLIVRTKPTYDGAEPSGNSIAALALQRLARLLDKEPYYAKAREILQASAMPMAEQPQAYLRMLIAADFFLYPPQEVALVGTQHEGDFQALVDAVFRPYVPNKVVAGMDPSAEGSQETARFVPLLEGRNLLNRDATAYVCRNFTCDLPLAEPQALVDKLRSGVAGGETG